MKQKKQPEQPGQPKIKTKTENNLYDANLSALMKSFDNCINPLAKINNIPLVCLNIAALGKSIQNYYISQICDKHHLSVTDFKNELKTVVKEIEDKKNADKENSENDPQVKRLEDFITKHYVLRNNVINNDIEFIEKSDFPQEYETLKELNLLRKLRQNHFKIKINELMETIKSEFTPDYNPFQEYFNNIPEWDGVDHIAKLVKFIKTDEPIEFLHHFEKHLVRTVSCCLGINFNKQCFVFVGEGTNNQNMGKSTFIRLLCPPELKNYYSEELSFDKDGMTALAENFIINMDELATMQRTDINQFKTYLSKDFVKVRLPYERRASTIKRRASFFASTNECKFLTDLTGNVRWIAFKVTHINWNYHKEIDINKVWAQAHHYLINGKAEGEVYKYQLTVDEVAWNEKHNQEFMILPSEYEILSKYFESSTKKDYNDDLELIKKDVDHFKELPYTQVKFLTTSEISKLINDVTFGAIRLNIIAVGKALRKLDFQQSDQYSNNKNFAVKGYYLRFWHNGINLHSFDDEPEL